MDVQEIAARLREIDSLYKQRTGENPFSQATMIIHSGNAHVEPAALINMYGSDVYNRIRSSGLTIGEALEAVEKQVAAIPTPAEANAARIAALKAELAKLEGK